MSRFSIWKTAPLLLAFASFAPILHATAVTVPSGLAPGENYRIIFGTSTTTSASQGFIGYYNDFVTTAANLDAGLASLGTTWVVLGSTVQVNALENANLSTNDTATKFFNTRGELIAIGVSGINGLYGGFQNVHFNIIYTEAGNDVMDTLGNRLVWTGTSEFGTALLPFGNDGVYHGAPFAPTSIWTAQSIANRNAQFPVYGISGVLTAPEVPEPGTLVLTALAVAALLRHRNR